VELGWTSAGAHGPEKGAAGAGGRGRWGKLVFNRCQWPKRPVSRSLTAAAVEVQEENTWRNSICCPNKQDKLRSSQQITNLIKLKMSKLC